VLARYGVVPLGSHPREVKGASLRAWRGAVWVAWRYLSADLSVSRLAWGHDILRNEIGLGAVWAAIDEFRGDVAIPGGVFELSRQLRS